MSKYVAPAKFEVGLHEFGVDDFAEAFRHKRGGGYVDATARGSPDAYIDEWSSVRGKAKVSGSVRVSSSPNAY